MQSPLTVIIVGGGIGGLSAAIALRGAGHSIKIIERSSFLDEVGAAVTLFPNAVRILDSWGLDHAKAHFTKFRGIGAFSAQTLQDLRVKVFTDYEAKFGTPRVNAHRVDLHSALKELATTEDGPGSPATIQLSCPVVSYDAKNGTVKLADGSEERADLIIAADGVHSQAATHILGYNAPATVSRSTVIRFLIPTETILKDPLTEPLLESGPGFWSTYAAADRKRYIVRYPCRDDTLQNFGMYVLRDLNNTTEKAGFRLKADRNALRQAMDGFHPTLLALCDKAAEILPLWICAEREPLPRCYRGRMVLIGDASHPMLPHRGQGAAASIEDAAALGELFKDVQSSELEVIESKLKMFQDVRLNRASATQILSHENFFGDPINGPKQRLLKFLPESELCQNAGQMDAWFSQYDVVRDIQRTMGERQHATAAA
ncbi:salicylate hydroxylase-like protein [Rhizodiscina lignyota]|uniref:Salicylate hydroxylase-like protein n=1 Tax=Rhizodiscina lignyota TaxID=1504668 RepID=A0A9P4I781_9PEZI|nr:salicylate hydroxylase-like protein [Rhizodiscina lignyota]